MDEATQALRGRIVDAAMALAAGQGWHDVSLNQVAERLGLGLADIAAHFRDRDAIADAWFARALAAMLAPPPEGFAELAASARAETMILRWFRAQSAHARVAGEMLLTKAWPSHPHHWVPMVFNLSRLVHWWLDAARIEHTGFRRMAEEVRLTALLLRALVAWQADARAGEAEALPRTERVLRRGLAWLDR
jgi:AcrR family transcriptional regulator